MKQNWLYRIARYIDKTNIIEFFEAAVIQEPPITSRSSPINIVHVGRMKATAYVFRLDEVKKNRKLWDAFRALSDYYRAYQSHKLIIEVLKKDLRDAELKAIEMNKSLDDQISKVAFTFTTLENPSIHADMIISNNKNADPKVSDAVMLNCKIIKYVFCTDTILDHGNDETQDITRQSLELDVRLPSQEIRSPTPSRMETVVSPTASSKVSPSRMDAERPRN